MVPCKWYRTLLLQWTVQAFRLTLALKFIIKLLIEIQIRPINNEQIKKRLSYVAVHLINLNLKKPLFIKELCKNVPSSHNQLSRAT